MTNHPPPKNHNEQLRSEMLALHGAQEPGGAQFYIGCAQLAIEGGSGSSCAPKISLPGAYKADDANIYIPNFYNGFDPTTYAAPGGEVATCCMCFFSIFPLRPPLLFLGIFPCPLLICQLPNVFRLE